MSVVERHKQVHQRRTLVLLASLVVLATLHSSCIVGALSVSHHRYAGYAGLAGDVEQEPEQLLSNYDIDDLNEMNYARNTAVKRDGSKGTCTCTCETRPAQPQSSEQAPAAAAALSGIQVPAASREPSSRTPPESASLIRTAARMETHQRQQPASTAGGGSDSAKVSSGSKVNSAGQQQQQQVKSNVGQIVKVPPLNDVIATEHDAGAEDHGQGQQSNEQWESVLNSGQDSWGHGSRYPWKRLPDTMCYREPCQTDKDCCLRYNLCDKSAHVCVDCWYGSTCTSERDCCFKYPYCQREWKPSPVDGRQQVVGGKCVNEM